MWGICQLGVDALQIMHRNMQLRSVFGWLVPLLTWASEHDRYQAKTPIYSAPQDYLGDVDGTGRRLGSTTPVGSQTCPQVFANATWGSLRITYDLVNQDSLNAATAAYVTGTLLPRVISYLNSVLQVRQATSPLKVDSSCTYKVDAWTSFIGSPYCFNAVSPQCGPDGFKIPAKYLRSMQYCSQVAQILPNQQCNGACGSNGACTCQMSDWKANRSSYCCGYGIGSVNGIPVPTGCSLENATFYGTGLASTQNAGATGILCKGGCTTVPEGQGAVESDYHAFVSVNDTAACNGGADGPALAYATYCVKDQCDRPTFGYINICPFQVPTDSKSIELQVSTLVHEFTHTLVFSSGLFPYFRNGTTGEPLIARGSSQDTFPGSVDYRVTESPEGGLTMTWPATTNYRTYIDVSPTIVQVFNERGLADCQCPVGKANITPGCFTSVYTSASGLKVPTCAMRMVLPTVQAEARKYFNCSTLSGPELENQPTDLGEIFSSHWEQRVLNDEVMAPVTSLQGAVPLLTSITLAIYQDSGWYMPDFTQADVPVKGQTWGYQQGCDFATKKCIDNSVPSNRNFCTAQSGLDLYGCSADRTGKFQCDLNGVTLPASLPQQLSYFNGSTKLGQQVHHDYCPTYSLSAGPSYTCGSSTPLFYWKDQNQVPLNILSEFMGTSSRCLMSSLVPANVGSLGYTFTAAGIPGCYGIQCAPDASSYQVIAGQYSGQNVGVAATTSLGTCTAQGQQLTVPGYSGMVLCADPGEMCSLTLVRHVHGAVNLSAPLPPRLWTPFPAPATPATTPTPTISASTTARSNTQPLASTVSVQTTAPAATNAPGSTVAPAVSTAARAASTAAPSPTTAGTVTYQGQFVLSGVNVAAVSSNSTLVAGLKNAVASLYGVQPGYVAVSFLGRRLQSRSQVTVLYIISVPASQTQAVQALQTAVASGVASKANLIQQALSQNLAGVQLTVQSAGPVTTPTPMVATTARLQSSPAATLASPWILLALAFGRIQEA